MSEKHEVRKEISKIDNIFHQKRVLNQVARETNFTYAIPNKYKFLGINTIGNILHIFLNTKKFKFIWYGIGKVCFMSNLVKNSLLMKNIIYLGDFSSNFVFFTHNNILLS